MRHVHLDENGSIVCPHCSEVFVPPGDTSYCRGYFECERCRRRSEMTAAMAEAGNLILGARREAGRKLHLIAALDTVTTATGARTFPHGAAQMIRWGIYTGAIVEEKEIDFVHQFAQAIARLDHLPEVTLACVAEALVHASLLGADVEPEVWWAQETARYLRETRRPHAHEPLPPMGLRFLALKEIVQTGREGTAAGYWREPEKAARVAKQNWRGN